MIEQERDDLLARLLAGMERLEAGQTELRQDVARIEDGQTELRQDVARILRIVQGQAEHRVATDKRLSALERAVG